MQSQSRSLGIIGIEGANFEYGYEWRLSRDSYAMGSHSLAKVARNLNEKEVTESDEEFEPYSDSD
jgi:hypothetical protein